MKSCYNIHMYEKWKLFHLLKGVCEIKTYKINSNRQQKPKKIPKYKNTQK